jgi:GNAT superfamily N-acetyltransferase
VTFTVRRLRHGDDTRAAEELLIRFFREEAFSTPENIIRSHCREMLEVETCGLFIAEADGKPAGIATVSMQFGIEFGWLGEMGDLYVLPAHRGQGVARALIHGIEDFLQSRGASDYQVTLTTHSQSQGLRDFYSKLGFAQEGREILYRKFSLRP